MVRVTVSPQRMKVMITRLCVCVCVLPVVCVTCVCNLCVLEGGWARISDLRPVNWGWPIQMGTKAVSPVGKILISGSVVKVRIRFNSHSHQVSTLCW